MSGLIKKAVAWNLAGHVIQTVSLLAQAAIVSRMLSPTEVGIFAVAKTIQTFVRSTPNSGILYSLATLPRIRKLHFQMIACFMPVVGILQFLLMLLGAGAASLMFGPSPIILCIPWLAGLCIIESFQLPGEATKLRLIDHRQLVMADLAVLASSLFGLAVGFSLGLGTFSLIIAAYCDSVTKAVYYYFVIWSKAPPIWPRIRMVGPILSHSFKLTFSTILLLASTQGDRLMMGLVHGPAAAAGYWRTNQIINLPLALYSRISYRVFVSASSDEARSGLKPEWMAKVGLNLSLRLGAAFGLVLALFSGSITHVLLGSMWQSAASVMAVLAPFVCFKFLARSLDPLMVGGRHTSASITGQLLLAGGIVLGILAAAPAGVFWACLLVGIAQAVSGIYYIGASLKRAMLMPADIYLCLGQTIKDVLLCGLPTITVYALLIRFGAPEVLQTAAAVVLIMLWAGSVLLHSRKGLQIAAQ